MNVCYQYMLHTDEVLNNKEINNVLRNAIELNNLILFQRKLCKFE